MFGDLLDVTDDRERFFVLVLLEKAKDHVAKEQTLNEEDLKVNDGLILVHSKSGLVRLAERVLARSKQHYQVEGGLPLAVYLYHQAGQEGLAFYNAGRFQLQGVLELIIQQILLFDYLY